MTTNNSTARPDNVEFLRPREVSRRFAISPRTLSDWIKHGAIASYLVKSPGRKEAGARLIDVASVRAFIIKGEGISPAAEGLSDGGRGA